MSDPPDATRPDTRVIPTAPPSHLDALELPRFTLEVLEGATPLRWQSDGPLCAIGSHPSNDVVLAHPSISRFHCRVEVSERGARVVDRESTNGTAIDGVRVRDAWLKDGALLMLGSAKLRFAWGQKSVRVALSERRRVGPLVGDSIPMRELFALIERCARSEATVLITGETGTGKEGVAEALHEESGRAGGPLVFLDCGAIPQSLLESELFGHERGAFSGATERRIGAFESAQGGTIVLDEIGELPLDLQPKILRVLEQRTIRRVGGTERISVDVRVIAATRRDVEAEVNAGTFRSDLYYRLAVVRLHVPPLRERLDDIPLLVETLLERLGVSDADRERLSRSAFLRRLRAASWPGNVRELRNALERALVLETDGELPAGVLPSDAPLFDPRIGWADARQAAIDRFERRYLEALLAHHDGNVTRAAQAAGLDRVYLHRLLRRHGLRG